MNVKTLASRLIGLAVLVLLVGPAQAKEDKKAQEAEQMQAMMARAKELGTPGAAHAVLKPMEGNWSVKSRSWMKPGDKVQESTATSSLSWVLGGRFLKQEYKGDWAGQPFEGLGYMGYDNIKKEYMMVWMDNMATGIFQSTGQYDEKTKTIEQSGTFSCPMTGEKNMWFRSEWKTINNDNSVFRMYMKDPEGKEFKSMELTYKRVK